MKCQTEGCEHDTLGRKFCGTCRSKASRQRDPIRYSFNNKKHRAKERGIFWDLTLEQFTQFCYETEYMDKKGKFTGCYDVDRKIEGKTPGYTIDNIQILEKVENIKKYKKFSWKSKKAEQVIEIIFPKEDLPF